MTPDPRCDNCIGHNIDGNRIPVCIREGCPKMKEYYPGKSALDVRHAVWREFSSKLKPKK